MRTTSLSGIEPLDSYRDAFKVWSGTSIVNARFWQKAKITAKTLKEGPEFPGRAQPPPLSEFKTSSRTCAEQGILILEIFQFGKNVRQRLLIM